MEDLLKEWGVDDATIIASFKANHIEVGDLATLSEEDLRTLVPCIGPRNRIKRHIAKLVESNNNNSKQSVNSDQGKIVLNDEASELFQDLISEAETSEETTNKNSEPSEQSERSESTGSQSRTKSKGAEAAKRSLDSSEAADFQSFLEKSPKGSFVLKQYKANKKLVDVDRNKLCDVIVNREIRGDLDRRISRERCEALGKLVVNQFPTELLSTWYRIEDRPNQDGTVVKGRIITRFYTMRRTLINNGMVDEENDEEENDDDAMDISEDNEEVAEALAWLRSKNVSPWTRVLTAWKLTSKSRIAKLQAPIIVPDEGPSKRKSRKVVRKRKTNNDKVYTYTAEFPQIYQPTGWHLLEIDFELYRPDALLKLSAEYPKLERFVLSKLRQLDRNNLYDDFDDKTADEKTIFTFRELSRSFAVSTLTHNRSGDVGNWRTSKQEMKDGFLLHVNGRGQLKESLKIRQDKLSKFGFTDQPLPVIVDTGNNKQCLVIFDKTEYEVESPLKAVDVAFKSYHALHADYPIESEHMWMFLQKAIYKFDTKWDKYANIVDMLVAEFNNF